MPETCEIEKTIKKLHEASRETANNEKTLASSLLDYLEVKENCPEAFLYQVGITPDKSLIEKISKIKEKDVWEEAIREKAEEYLKEAWSKKGLSHKERRKKIDGAIKLLKRFEEEKKEDISAETLLVLARAYLRRSQIIRPKGLTTPAKKKEAIDKGIQITNKAIKSINNNGGIKEEVYRIRGLLYVEKERILEDDEWTIETLKEIKDALKEAIDNGCDRFKNLEDDVKIAVVYSELCEELGVSINDGILAKVAKSDASNIELEKARAYRLLWKKNNKSENRNGIVKEIENLIDKRLFIPAEKKYIPFSSPIWDDTVRFLVRLYRDDNDIWKKLSLKLWEACKNIEENTPFTLHIRWYWSRMRDLYDLAFIAADKNYKLKVEIADSLKSRPAMKWNVLEELTEGEPWIKELYEAEARAFTGGYIVEYDKLKDKFKEITNEDFKNPEILDIENDVPTDWIVIHFYLNHLKKSGYALIYDKDNWYERSFEFDRLFDAYMTWQTDYNHRERGFKRESATSLEKLCKAIGEAMSFLFELSNDKNVLFIPHDFLHRLPLHGAIKTDENGKPETIFLEKHPSCYLPAWGMIKRESAPSTSGKYLLEKKGDSIYKRIKWDVKGDGYYKQFDALPNNPHLLFIYCHGKADHVNPFKAKLLIEENGKTYLDIRSSAKNFQGSHLFLGACETDLIPPLSDVLDEHLSISTVFLDKGASEITGTMYEVLTNDVANIIEYILEVSSSKNLRMLNEIWKCQKEMIKNYMRNYAIEDLYKGIAFKVISLP